MCLIPRPMFVLICSPDVPRQVWIELCNIIISSIKESHFKLYRAPVTLVTSFYMTWEEKFYNSSKQWYWLWRWQSSPSTSCWVTNSDNFVYQIEWGGGGVGETDYKVCIQGKMHTLFLLRSKPCPPRQFIEVVHLKVRECYPYTDEI